MMLLRLITLPYVRKHLLRSVLTTGGIVLGVALLVGMHTANQSVLHAFNDTVNRIAGKAQLQVSTGDAGFPEEVLERVQSVREVLTLAPGAQQIDHLDCLGVVVNHTLHETDVGFCRRPLGRGCRGRGQGLARLSRRTRLYDGGAICRRFCLLAERCCRAQTEQDSENRPNSHAPLYNLVFCPVNRKGIGKTQMS
jgi:hypothetical protein